MLIKILIGSLLSLATINGFAGNIMNMNMYKSQDGNILLTNISPSGHFSKFTEKVKQPSYSDSVSSRDVYLALNDESEYTSNSFDTKQNEKHTLADNLGEIKKKAEQGNSRYQVKLGMIYYEGKNIRQDFVLARKMFQKAANQGDIQGQNMLGFFYENGLGGLSKNKSTAKEWYGKTCDTGNEYGCTQYRQLNEGGYPNLSYNNFSYSNSAFKALR